MIQDYVCSFCGRRYFMIPPEGCLCTSSKTSIYYDGKESELKRRKEQQVEEEKRKERAKKKQSEISKEKPNPSWKLGGTIFVVIVLIGIFKSWDKSIENPKINNEPKFEPSTSYIPNQYDTVRDVQIPIEIDENSIRYPIGDLLFAVKSGIKIRKSNSIQAEICGVLEKDELVMMSNLMPKHEKENITSCNPNKCWYLIQTLVPPIDSGWVYGGCLKHLSIFVNQMNECFINSNDEPTSLTSYIQSDSLEYLVVENDLFYAVVNGARIRVSNSIQARICGVLEKDELVKVTKIRPKDENESITSCDVNKCWYFIQTLVPPIDSGWVYGGCLKHLLNSSYATNECVKDYSVEDF